MKAIILAAGQGARLKKYTENLPKGMLKFMGESIIERQIKLYRECGIQDIIIIKGYAADRISYEGIKYYVNEEFATTNMVESLLTAKEEFDDDIIISYSDILFETYLLKRILDAKGDFVVSVDINWKKYWKARYGEVNYDTESLKMDPGGNIISLGKENPPLEDIDARYIGLLKFSRIGMKIILKIMDRDYLEYRDKPWKQSGKSIRKAYMTDLLQAIIENGNKVKAECFKGGWIEFDTNEDYERICQWVQTGEIGNFINL